MFLSQLLIDVGQNPDRPRPGRLWLRNIYHVHQRLSMAFPSARRREDDPWFLQPWTADDFQPARFLFRIDNARDPQSPRAVILVLSELEPDWDYAFQNSPFLAAPPQTRPYAPALATGQRLRYRIRINLSHKKNAEHRGAVKGHDAQGRPRTQGKRIALTWDEGQQPIDVIAPWFARKAQRCGFEPDQCRLLRLGWVRGRPTGRRDQDPMRFRDALLEGTLTVTDAEAFAQTLRHGLGSAKAFGFGLLSIAPLAP